jgi:hypothetical protein
MYRKINELINMENNIKSRITEQEIILKNNKNNMDIKLSDRINNQKNLLNK